MHFSVSQFYNLTIFCNEKNDFDFSSLEQMFDFIAVWEIWSILEICCVFLDFDVGLDGT